MASRLHHRRAEGCPGGIGLHIPSELEDVLVRYERETIVEKQAYKVCKMVAEQRVKTCSYTVCRMVPEQRVRTCSYRVCKMVQEQCSREECYKVCTMVKETRTEQVPVCITRPVHYTKTVDVVRPTADVTESVPADDYTVVTLEALVRMKMCQTEFGRQPAAQGKGRDHNAGAFTVWMAGGGIKGGTSYGTSDELGFKAEEHPTFCYDLHATALHLLGIDHTKLSVYNNGIQRRLTDVHGHVIPDIVG